MKVTKHGKYSNSPLAIKAICPCGCEMEVSSGELEGNSSHYVWCPECKEMVMISQSEIDAARRVYLNG